MRPVRAKALKLLAIFKAFALTGRQVCVRNYPGRCPGLGVSALSGRVGQNRACGTKQGVWGKTGRVGQNLKEIANDC